MQLYQEVVLRHNRNPVGRDALAELHAEITRCRGDNPLCGEHLELRLRLLDGHIVGIGFAGELGALTTASASMLCALMQGASVQQAQQLITRAFALLLEPGQPQHDSLGEFNAFSVVAQYPNRIKTVTLPWATLAAALAGATHTSTDELPQGTHAR